MQNSLSSTFRSVSDILDNNPDQSRPVQSVWVRKLAKVDHFHRLFRQSTRSVLLLRFSYASWNLIKMILRTLWNCTAYHNVSPWAKAVVHASLPCITSITVSPGFRSQSAFKDSSSHFVCARFTPRLWVVEKLCLALKADRRWQQLGLRLACVSKIADFDFFGLGAYRSRICRAAWVCRCGG